MFRATFNSVRRILTITLIALLPSFAAFPQARTLTGRLLDADTQKPVKDANVILLGTSFGAVSNHLGYFRITFEKSNYKTLVVSRIGYKTTDIIVPEADNFKFFLKKGYLPFESLNLDLYPQDTSTFLYSPQDPLAIDHQLETNASFPGGIHKFFTFVGNALADKIPIQPHPDFTITFTIGEDGRASNISVSDTTQRVVVESLFKRMPVWIPATQHHTHVAQHFTIPVTRGVQVRAIGGTDFTTYVSKNIRYPAMARSTGTEGLVFVQFRLDESGKPEMIQILKDIGSNCGFEVRRVLTSLPPKFGNALSEKTHASTFILTVAFGIGKPFESNNAPPKSDAFLLDRIQITAIGIEREIASKTVPAAGEKAVYRTGTPNEIVSKKGSTTDPKKSTRFSLINSQLVSFPPMVLESKSLVYLNLEKNYLRTLPADIQRLTKLQEVYLFSNKIENLPSTFGTLKNLKVVGLGSNQLKAFPEAIMQLEKLEILDLGGNQITSLPTNIAALKNLKILVLHDNNISHIPESFYDLKKLKKLYLQGNPLDPKDQEMLKKSFRNVEIVF